MSHRHSSSEPLWPTIRRNWRDVTVGLALFAATTLTVAVFAVPIFRLGAALFLTLFLAAGGK